MTWSQIAEVAAQLRPRTLLILGCFAGLSTVTLRFFEAVPSLQIYLGCPIGVAAIQGLPALIDFLPALRGELATVGSSIVSVLLEYALNGSPIYSRTRSEWASGDIPSAWIVQDVCGLVAKVCFTIAAAQSGGRHLFYSLAA